MPDFITMTVRGTVTFNMATVQRVTDDQDSRVTDDGEERILENASGRPSIKVDLEVLPV